MYTTTAITRAACTLYIPTRTASTPLTCTATWTPTAVGGRSSRDAATLRRGSNSTARMTNTREASGTLQKESFGSGTSTSTPSRTNELRVDLEDVIGGSGWAKYSRFKLDDRDNFTSLTLSGFSGNVTDTFGYHRGYKFSGNDSGGTGGNCSLKHGAGWWFHTCYHACLNKKMYHMKWSVSGQSLNGTTLLIRPVIIDI
ncbi:ryncolin-1-like [Penaeus chinensis]|uniref:ryncolin-1-like n=1 Tax=Penaeus chinensis TaxID=139456 RepID=UPI001FB6E8BE|nr:ryncolin-1-like [Penaeus chinensis]